VSARSRGSDPGVAGERTDLAWNRSGLAVLVCVAVLLRRAWPLDRADHVVALALIGVGASAWAVGLVTARSVSRTTHQGRDVMGAGTLRLICLGTTALAAGTFVLGLLLPP
jgi:uncharacterized membrane protein YidH (DUF202 family)